MAKKQKPSQTTTRDTPSASGHSEPLTGDGNAADGGHAGVETHAAASPGLAQPQQPAALLGWVLPWLGLAALMAGLLAMPVAWPAPSGGAGAVLTRLDSVHTAAVLAALAAVLALAVGQLRNLLSARVLAVALAVLAVRWGEASVPGTVLWPIDDTLRAPLAGVTPQAFATLAIAGLAALAAGGGHTARVLAALGLCGMALTAWMPVGVSGELRVPWLVALDGSLPMGAQAGGEIVATALHHRVALLLLGPLSLVGLVLVLLRRTLAPQLALALTVAAALPVLVWAQAAGVWALMLQGGGLLAGLAWIPSLAKLDKRQVIRPHDLLAAVEPLAVALLIAAYLLLKANGLRYSTTDEALYFYAAKLWSQGTLPYRDFFFSHPPLHIAVPALLYKWFGFHFLIGKWLSALAALVAALFGWRIARHWLGIWGGLLALALQLLACEVLQASTNLTGVNLTAAWLMAGLWAGWVRRNFLWTGLLLGAAASTGFYAVGGVVVWVVLAALLPWRQQPRGPLQWQRHPLLQTLLGFVLVWGGIALLCRVIGGEGYTQGVYDYHFAKRAKVEGFVNLTDHPLAFLSNFLLMIGSARDFQVTLYYHAAHAWLALLLPLTVVARGHVTGNWRDVVDPRRWWQAEVSRPLLAWLALAALLVEFGNFKERYDFYFALLLPLASIAAAATLVGLGELGSMALSQRPRALLWLAALAVLALNWTNINMSANRSAYPSEFSGAKMDGKGPGERLDFEWLEPPGPPWVGEWTRALLWKPYRIRGSIEAGMHHYLWSKKRWFSTAEAIAEHVRSHTSAEETISGASDYAPLIALLADRKMAGHHVDTNSKVFSTGAVPLERFWDEACRDKLKYLVVAPQSYFAPQDLPKRASVVQNFHREQVFTDPYLKHWRTQDIELWVRNGDAPCSYKGARGVAPALMN